MNKINYNILKRIKKESHETEHKAKISIYISCFFVFLFFGIFYYSIEKNKKTNLNNELENNQNKNYETINDIIHKKSNIYIKNLIAENELTFRGNKKERQLELNKIYYGFVYLNYVTLLNEEIFNNKKMLELSLPTTEMLYDTNITNIKNINSEYIHKLEEIIIWIESKNFVYLNIQLIEIAKLIQLNRFSNLKSNPNYRLFSYEHRIKLYEMEDIITKIYECPNNYSTFGIGHKIYTSKKEDALLIKLINAVNKNINDSNYKKFILSFIALIYYDLDIHNHETYFNSILQNKNATISQNVFDAIIFYSFNRGMYGANSDLIEFNSFSKTNNVDTFIQNSLANEYQNAVNNISILTKRRKIEYQMSISNRKQ